MDKVDSKDLGNNTQLSLLGAHEKLGREHCDLLHDHIELKLEFKVLKFQLKDKIQQVVDLEKQLAKVLNDNYRLKAELQAAGIFSCPSNLFNQEK